MKIGFYGCAHLGYRMGAMNRSHPSGLNLREYDGYYAHQTIVEEMLNSGVDGIVDGGDLFHVEHPPVRATAEALHVDDLRVAAGADQGRSIWRRTNGGNHDNGASTATSAVSHINRVALDSLAVYPHSGTNIGPHPGLYEIHQPNPEKPVYLHIISHNGLDGALAERGIAIDPQPIPGAVNILVSHGIFSADGRLFGACDRHGAERVIPAEWADRPWATVILSDYHTLGPIPGFGPDDDRDGPEVWMTGSGVRRGFSDEDADRGWLEVTVDDLGGATVTPHPIWQRPQVDFPAIDARGMAVADIDALVRQRLSSQPMTDADTAERTGDGGVILRQNIAYTTQAQRQALAGARREWALMAQDAAFWAAPYPNPQTTEVSPGESPEGADTFDPSCLDFAAEFMRRVNTGGTVTNTLSQVEGEGDDVREAIIAKTRNTLQSLQSANTTD